MLFYKVAEPNEALIISGLRAHAGPEGDAAGLGFKIVVGKGAFYVPGLQKVRHLSLDIHEAELDRMAGTDYGIGLARHLRPPHDGSALPPGLPPHADVMHARLTKWVEKAIG